MVFLLVLLSAIAPRIVFLIVWVARPNMVDAAFTTWIWPLLGIIFLPFATLVYVILWTAGGLSSSDWLWVGLAVLIDIIHSGAGYSRRRA
jgi:hypothetical protein